MESLTDRCCENKIVVIWQDVLCIDQMGIDQGFLQAGGDSLQATRIANQVADKVGLEIPSYLVIECMTIRKLAATIEGAVFKMKADHFFSSGV